MKNFGQATRAKVQRSIKIAQEEVHAILTDHTRHGMYIVTVPEQILEDVALRFALLDWELYGGAIACPQYLIGIPLRSSHGDDVFPCKRCAFGRAAHNQE